MIPDAILAALHAIARAALPAECCGYLTGPAPDTVDAIVACHNAADDPARAFAIDGAELFALVRSFDGPAPARVIYHSHPNGRAYFSPSDRALAVTAGYPVQHLVIGDGEAALFAWDETVRDFVEAARWGHRA